MKLWAIQYTRVVCSGLRARQLVQVGDKAFVYRVYHRGSKGTRWVTTRTPVVGVNDHRGTGDELEVARVKTMTHAIDAIAEDARKLERFEQQELPT